MFTLNKPEEASTGVNKVQNREKQLEQRLVDPGRKNRLFSYPRRQAVYVYV
jgi:hypothetical protein